MPEQEQEGHAAGQHVSAALDSSGKNPGDNALEGWPRHDTVLHGEQREQSQVNQERKRREPIAAESMDLGTAKLPINPAAYRNVAKKIT